MDSYSDMRSGAYVDSSGVLRQRVAAQPSAPQQAFMNAAPQAPPYAQYAAPAQGYQQGYAPQGYAPQGYAPQGYAPQGYAPLQSSSQPRVVVRETTYNRYNETE